MSRRRAPWAPCRGVEREPQRGRGDARPAAGDDRRLEVDAAGGERLRDACRAATSRPFSISCGRRHVERARHVARAHARARLRRSPEEALGRPRVDHLRGFVGQGRAHVGERQRPVRGLSALNVRGARLTAPASSGRPSRLPFRQAAVEDEHVLGAEQRETSTTPAGRRPCRRRHRPRWCRCRRCRARRPRARTVRRSAACGAGDWNGRRSRRCRSAPRRECGRRDIRPRRRACIAGR